MLLAEEANKIVEALSEMNDQAIVSIPKMGPFDFSITNTVHLHVGVGRRGVRRSSSSSPSG